MKDSKKVKARASFVHNSPRKLRLVLDAIRGLSPQDAISRLKLLPQRAAKPILDVYQQAVGNAKNNFQMSPANLVVASAQILGGPRIAKKSDVHAHGARFDRGIRRKKLSHIEIVLKEGANGAKN
ncbi:MAG: 50S ribosomal protein L22 [Microgenomates group bacterium Gr01-1014_16]|nr:MAG: 50S ribosomal protein L22 [Microgenomates group bacterium Gr01-1014_16]